MLALLEHQIWELRGAFVMEDTDSVAIVATEQGGLVPCRGGPCRTARVRKQSKQYRGWTCDPSNCELSKLLDTGEYIC
jgi:hypothetical protein